MDCVFDRRYQGFFFSNLLYTEDPVAQNQSFNCVRDDIFGSDLYSRRITSKSMHTDIIRGKA